MLACVVVTFVPFDLRYKDKADHEDSTGLLPVGDVASTDTEQTRNNVWRNLKRCQLEHIKTCLEHLRSSTGRFH